MKKNLFKLMKKGDYMPPTTESIVILCTNKVICASDPTGNRSTVTEVWEIEDLSTL